MTDSTPASAALPFYVSILPPTRRGGAWGYLCDACPQPFLITLVGPYAESEDVFFDSPWQGDVDYGEMVDGVFVPKQPRCDDCRALLSHGIEDLRFPVVVLVQEPR